MSNPSNKRKRKKSESFSYLWIFVILIVIIGFFFVFYKGKIRELIEFTKKSYDQGNENKEKNNKNKDKNKNNKGKKNVFKGKNNKKKWKREELCRDIFESIYLVPFKSCRPNFLKNPKTGRNLELDGYNEELKIAFEHNGRHHYEYPNTWHRTRVDYLVQIKRDKTKKELCIKNNIYLISIPYHIPEKEIRTYIISKLPKDYTDIETDLDAPQYDVYTDVDTSSFPEDNNFELGYSSDKFTLGNIIDN